MTDITVEEAPEKSFKNWDDLSSPVQDCSCYQCIRHFKTSEITSWWDDGLTAICPNCGIDSILPGEIPTETLAKMNERWFGGVTANET